MARQVKTVETASFEDGTEYTFTALLAADGGQYDNVDQAAKQVFSNTTSGAIVVTISTDKVFSPQETTLTAKTFTVPADAVAFEIPPLENNWWAQEGTTNIYVDVASDGLNWAVVKPPA